MNLWKMNSKTYFGKDRCNKLGGFSLLQLSNSLTQGKHVTTQQDMQDVHRPLHQAPSRRKLNLMKWLLVSDCKRSCQVDFVHVCVSMSLTFCESTSNAARQRRTAGAWTTSPRSPTLFSTLDLDLMLSFPHQICHRFTLHPRSSGWPPNRQRTLSRASLPALISQRCRCKTKSHSSQRGRGGSSWKCMRGKI